MTDTAQTLKVPQERETQVRVVPGGAVSYRFAYARAADTRAAGDVGQDYLTVREDAHTFTFVLCDGVSQSFYGDLAARYLGDALLAWLSGHLPATVDAEPIRTALAAHLRELTESATGQVQRLSLPPDLPPMLREVLQEKRALGSESTFVCGRIDLTGGDFPAGRVVLAWMGDSRLRLWTGDDAHTTDLGGVFETAQRWSTRRGPVGGDVNVFIAPLERDGRRINRLMAYSDWLAGLDDWSRDPSNHAVQDLITQAGEAATSDDVSFLEVWLGPVPAHIEAGPLAAPYLLDEARGVVVPEIVVPVVAPVEPVEPEPPLIARPSEKIPIRLGCAVALLIVVGIAILLAGLTLPVNGPLHKIIFGPTLTHTPTVSVVPVETPVLPETPTSTWTPIPTETPTGTPTATPTVFSPPPTATQESPVKAPPFDSAVPTPAGAPMASPPHTSTPVGTPAVRPTLAPIVEDTPAPSTMPAEPAPAEVSTP